MECAEGAAKLRKVIKNLAKNEVLNFPSTHFSADSMYPKIRLRVPVHPLMSLMQYAQQNTLLQLHKKCDSTLNSHLCINCLILLNVL